MVVDCPAGPAPQPIFELAAHMFVSGMGGAFQDVDEATENVFECRQGRGTQVYKV